MKTIEHFRFMFEHIHPSKLTKIINKTDIKIVLANRYGSWPQTSEKINPRGLEDTLDDLGYGSW